MTDLALVLDDMMQWIQLTIHNIDLNVKSMNQSTQKLLQNIGTCKSHVATIFGSRTSKHF